MLCVYVSPVLDFPGELNWLGLAAIALLCDLSRTCTDAQCSLLAEMPTAWIVALPQWACTAIAIFVNGCVVLQLLSINIF